MGKGNRSRADRAEELIVSTSPAQAKKQKKTNKVTILVTVLVVVLIAAFALAALCVNNGWLERSKTAVSSDHFKVSGTMMSYYVSSYYNQNLAANAASYGIDTQQVWSTQKCMFSSKNVTWGEYIAAMLKEQIEQKLAFCEGAKKDGIELEKAEKDSIAQQMDLLKEYAAQQLMSANSYCAQLFGTGVRVSDVEKAMELDMLAQKYYTKLYDADKEELRKDSAAEELRKYADEHPEAFLSACTLQYAFTATLNAAGAEATETEKADFEAAKLAMAEKANTLKAAAVDEAAFKAWVAEDLCGANAEDVYSSAFASAFKSVADADMPDSAAIDSAKAAILDYCKKTMQGETVTAPDFGTGKGATQFKTLCDSVYASLVTNGFNATDKDVTYSDPTDSSATELAKWLFADGRKAGEAEVIKAEADTSATYTVVFVKEAAALDETPTRDVAHILVSSSAQADEILNQFKSGEKQDLDAFKALGENVTLDSSIVYENVMKGQMVEEFENWLFDETRKAGDTGIVETDYGYHVMFFVGESMETWKYMAVESLVNDRLLAWCEQAVKDYGVKANDTYFKEV